MEQSVASCDYVVLICTEAYVEKADMRAGGVGFESRLLASLLLTSSQIESKGVNRLIPVVRQTGQVRRLPMFAGSRLYADFSADASGVEAAYETLVRTLHGTPKHEPPPLGFNPFARSAHEGITPVRQQTHQGGSVTELVPEQSAFAGPHGPQRIVEGRTQVNPAPERNGDPRAAEKLEDRLGGGNLLGVDHAHVVVGRLRWRI